MPADRRRNPGAGGDDTPCTDGEQQCSGTTLQTCSGGAFVDTEECELACSPGIGCTVCVPGTGTCNGNEGHACNSDGSGFIDATCDPVQGMACDGNSGQCTGPCAPQNLLDSYIGCEYYPTVTGNMVSSSYNFAVAVANTSASAATVTVEGGGLTAPMSFTVAANAVTVQTLPWVPDLKLCMGASWANCSGGAHSPARRRRSRSPATSSRSRTRPRAS